jgi:hypothetical protein
MIDIELLLKTKDAWQLAFGIVTLLSPMILSLIQQPQWGHWKRVAMYAIFHTVTSTVYLGAKHLLDLNNLLWTVMAVAGLSIVSYMGFWKPLADNVEVAKTNAIRGLKKKAPLTASRGNDTRKSIMENSNT